jgi:hypothetical protein
MDDGLGSDLPPERVPGGSTLIDRAFAALHSAVHEVRAYGRLEAMRPGTVVLVTGPLDPPDRWAATAVQLRHAGYHVVAPDVTPTGPPYAVGWVAGAAGPLHAAAVATPIVLVGHGTAGPLLPALARTQRAARRQVGGYVFVDATLPRAGPQSHLELLRAADPEGADQIHAGLHGGEQVGPSDDTHDAADVPDPAAHDLWTEPLPPAIDWPDAPCGYVQTGADGAATGPLDWWARSAEQRGWLVDTTGRELMITLPEIIDRLAG